MDDYSVGTVQCDTFDITNKLKYSSRNQALVRSSTFPDLKPLAEHLGLDPNADHVVMVPFTEEPNWIGTPKKLIADLYEDWRVPKAATHHFYTNHRPRGFFKVSTSSTHCCWYHVPVEKVTQDFKHGTLHVLHLLDTVTSHVRVLVLYPPFLKTEIKLALLSLFATSLSYDELQWSQIHLVLVRAAIATFREARWALMALGSMTLRSLAVALESALEDGPIKDCGSSLSRLELSINYVLQIKVLMDSLCRYFESELPISDHSTQHASLSLMHNLGNDIAFLLDSYRFLKEHLLLSRHTLTISINIKNASYMRANTIALRRIAEQSLEDARQLKKQAKLSQQNSHRMTKIAYLTMFYLPLSFVATLFSMPFLNLDDNDEFSKLDKIWIYAVAAIASIAVTFLVSLAWDMLYTGLGSHSTKDASEEELLKNENKGLEPPPHQEPSPAELIQQVVAIIERCERGANPDDNHVPQSSTTRLENEAHDGNSTS